MKEWILFTILLFNFVLIAPSSFAEDTQKGPNIMLCAFCVWLMTWVKRTSGNE